MDVPSPFDSLVFKSSSGVNLTIRTMKLKDVPNFHEYRSNPAVARYQSWSEDYSMEEATNFVSEQVNKNPNIIKPGEWIQLAICRQCDDEIIGDCAFSPQEDQSGIVQIG